DFIVGRIARWTGSESRFGRWFDNLADIAFVLTALGCEAYSGAIPSYIPILIAISFSQYVLDSVWISRASVPQKSRLGHWGGIVNFALVLVLSIAPASSWPSILIERTSPLIG